MAKWTPCGFNYTTGLPVLEDKEIAMYQTKGTKDGRQGELMVTSSRLIFWKPALATFVTSVVVNGKDVTVDGSRIRVKDTEKLVKYLNKVEKPREKKFSSSGAGVSQRRNQDHATLNNF